MSPAPLLSGCEGAEASMCMPTVTAVSLMFSQLHMMCLQYCSLSEAVGIGDDVPEIDVLVNVLCSP
jgi:hypothetical protein